MPCIVNAQLLNNAQAAALLEALAALGIPRERIRMIPSRDGGEHRTDPILAGGIRGILVGGILGAVVGTLLLYWWSVPWIGALFGLVTGGIIGGRSGSNWIGQHGPRWFDFRSTRVVINAVDPGQAEAVRQVCGRLRLRQIRLTRSLIVP